MHMQSRGDPIRTWSNLTPPIETCSAEPAAHRRCDGFVCQTYLYGIIVHTLDEQSYRPADIPQLKALYSVLNKAVYSVL